MSTINTVILIICHENNPEEQNFEGVIYNLRQFIGEKFDVTIPKMKQIGDKVSEMKINQDEMKSEMTHMKSEISEVKMMM